MKRMVLLLLIWSLCGVASVKAQEVVAQQENDVSMPQGKYWFGTKLHVLSPNLGFETVLSHKWSIHNELFYYGWLELCSLKSVAASSSFKYYATGVVGRGMYLRSKVIAGYIFKHDDFRDDMYYVGLGVGLGYHAPFYRNSRLHWGVDAGLKFCPYFGGELDRDSEMASTGSWFEYMFFSPASLVDLNFSISYCF